MAFEEEKPVCLCCVSARGGRQRAFGDVGDSQAAGNTRGCGTETKAE